MQQTVPLQMPLPPLVSGLAADQPTPLPCPPPKAAYLLLGPGGHDQFMQRETLPGPCSSVCILQAPIIPTPPNLAGKRISKPQSPLENPSSDKEKESSLTQAWQL